MAPTHRSPSIEVSVTTQDTCDDAGKPSPTSAPEPEAGNLAPEPFSDWYVTDDVRPSTAVVELVAEFAATDLLELPPLGAVVDPDALDRLVTPGDPGDATGTVSISFSYAGYDVTVRGAGPVRGDGSVRVDGRDRSV